VLDGFLDLRHAKNVKSENGDTWQGNGMGRN